MMKIPLLIGKDSAGKNQFIDLSDIPVLMISHCDEMQLTSIFSQFGLFESSTRHYLITNTRYYNTWKFDKVGFRVFMRDEPEFDIISRNDLINQIIDEIIKRQKIMKQKKSTDFRRYNSLNTWNDIKLDYLFLFIDDIWDIIVSKPKKLALNFMMILLYGQYVGVHVVFASAISYRNLLQQLVGIYPILTIELKKKYGISEPVKISELGHELIFSAEDFVYYKKRSIEDMVRYYKF
jgi:hypothetical protein